MAHHYSVVGLSQLVLIVRQQLSSSSAFHKKTSFFFLTLQQFCHWCRLVWEWGFISLACFDTNSTSHVPSEQSSRLSYLLMLRKQGQAMQFPSDCFFSTVRPSFMKHVISIDLFLLYFNNIFALSMPVYLFSVAKIELFTDTFSEVEC